MRIGCRKHEKKQRQRQKEEKQNRPQIAFKREAKCKTDSWRIENAYAIINNLNDLFCKLNLSTQRNGFNGIPIFV